MNFASSAFVLSSLAASLACSAPRRIADVPDTSSAFGALASQPSRDASSGIFDLLTYNVAGLPGLLSASRPSVNTAQVSPLLNHYQLVVAQEDFAYHGELVESARHLYQVAPMPPSSTVFGDGLSTLSVYPLDDISRVRWLDCNGYLYDSADCLGEKGFSVARVTLSDRVSLDLYNLHAEAGHSEQDVMARRRGFDQLASYIVERSADRALLVAGDTNLDMHDAGDRQTLGDFQARTGLFDIGPERDGAHASLDRVLVRSSQRLDLKALAWSMDERFVDSAGEALSDHPAVAVRIAWNTRVPTKAH